LKMVVLDSVAQIIESVIRNHISATFLHNGLGSVP